MTKTKQKTSVGKNVEKQVPLYIAGETKTSSAILEHIWKFKKIYICTCIIWLYLSILIYSRNIKVYVHAKICI